MCAVVDDDEETTFMKRFGKDVSASTATIAAMTVSC